MSRSSNLNKLLFTCHAKIDKTDRSLILSLLSTKLSVSCWILIKLIIEWFFFSISNTSNNEVIKYILNIVRYKICIDKNSAKRHNKILVEMHNEARRWAALVSYKRYIGTDIIVAIFFFIFITLTRSDMVKCTPERDVTFLRNLSQHLRSQVLFGREEEGERERERERERASLRVCKIDGD